MLGVLGKTVKVLLIFVRQPPASGSAIDFHKKWHPCCIQDKAGMPEWDLIKSYNENIKYLLVNPFPLDVACTGEEKEEGVSQQHKEAEPRIDKAGLIDCCF